MVNGLTGFTARLLISLVFSLNAVRISAEHLAGPSFSITEENDWMMRTDRHYTQGLRLTYLLREQSATNMTGLNRLALALPFTPRQTQSTRSGFHLGQNIYTPADTSRPQLMLNDRPYAGLLYASWFVQRRAELSTRAPLLDHWQLDLGIIGPESLAEQAQDTVHRLFDFKRYQGWEHQLPTEPALAIKYSRHWRFARGDPLGFAAQLLPAYGASVGNIGTYAAVGSQWRVGYRLPGDFGRTTIDSLVPISGGRVPGRSRKPFGIYGLIGAEGRAVAYNTLLDGSLFHDSHQIRKKPFVGDVRFGAVITLYRFELGYTQTFRSKEYASQEAHDGFGSFTLTYHWY